MFSILDDECTHTCTTNDRKDNANYNRPNNRSDNDDHDQKSPASGNKKRVRRGRFKKRMSNSNVNINIAFNNVNRVTKPRLYDIRRFVKSHNIDIFGIAETWLSHEERIHVNGFNWVGKNRSGKKGGGTGFLISDKVTIIDDDLCNSKLDDFERLWLKVKIENDIVHICVAYFPVEGVNPDLTDELYNQLLSEVIQIEHDTSGDPHIMIMGDFNGRIGDMIYGGDPVRNSNGERLIKFCDDACLNIMNCSRKCYGKITWFRHPHSSCIDYMLTSDKTEDYIYKMVVDEDRNFHLGSDHNVIISHFNFKRNSNDNNCNNHGNDDDNRIFWNIENVQDWSIYQDEISSRFDNWDPNQYDNANSMWDSWKDNLLSIANEIIGCKEASQKGKQWWCKSIDEAIQARKQACKEHRKWSTGDNNNNKDLGDHLWEDYKTKKSRAKHLIHQKITQMRLNRSLTISKAGGPSSRDFWNNLRGTRRKDHPMSIKLPNSDNVTTNRNVMNQTVMHYWNTLGKMDMSINDNRFIEIQSHTSSIRQGNVFSSNNNYNNDDNSNNSSNNNRSEPNEYLNNIEIHFDDVKDIVSKLKNNKSPGLDNITNELIKKGGDSICFALNKLFTGLVAIENTPNDWNKGIIVPIYKKGAKNDLNNYRGITLTSCISKIFNRLIANCITDYIESNNILSEIQGGFRKDHRCEDHIFTLKSIVSARQAENKTTHLAFLDFRKAFDTVWRDGLLSIAWNIGIRGKIWNIIDSLYNNVLCNVKFGDIVTDFFEIDEGVKQGCVLSPILFCVYINELAKMLTSHNVGVSICNVNISCLFWADDVVLIAENEDDLNRMLDIAADFSRNWQLNFNHAKSNVLIAGKKINRNKLWKLGDNYISEVDSYKYLGVNINRNMSDHTHVNDLICKGNRLIGYIKSIINGHDDFNRVYYGDILWRTLALPALNYACAISTYSASDYKKLEKLQIQMARAILKAPRNTASQALIGDLGWDTIECIHNRLKVNYYSRLHNMDPHRWPKLLFNATFIMHDHNTNLRWKWLKSIQHILCEHEMNSSFSNLQYDNPGWINKFKVNGVHNNCLQWYYNACDKSSLKCYVMFKSHPYMETYLMDKLDFYGSSLKFRARANVLPLDGRLRSWVIGNDGTCTLCRNGLEDIKHFMLSCDALSLIRDNEMYKLYCNLKELGLLYIWNLFNSCDDDTKLCMVLGSNYFNVMYNLEGVTIDTQFDSFCKSYLKRAWSCRTVLKKHLTIVDV